MENFICRGRDTERNWHIGYYAIIEGESHIFTGDCKHLIDAGRIPVSHAIDGSTVGRATGLKDSSGKDIFRGDIVCSLSYPFHNAEGRRNYVGVVEWSEDNLWWWVDMRPVFDRVRGDAIGSSLAGYEDLLGSSLADHEDLEVVGNIYDNPELLQISTKEEYQVPKDSIKEFSEIVSCLIESFGIMGRITDVAYDSTLNGDEYINENVAFKYTDGQGVEHASLEWLERHEPHVGAPEPYYTLTERDKHLESNPLDVSEHELKVITEYLERFVATLEVK